MTVTLLLLGFVLLPAVGYALYQRPQRGLLLVAALGPFHDLLIIIPHGHSFVPWKESVLLLALLATFVTPNRSRPGVSLPWLPAAGILAVLGGISAIVVMHSIGAVYPIKITFFYMVMVTLIIWRAPLTERDRDNLVSIMMAVSTITAIWGIVQQFVGAQFLVDLGYKYGDAVRTTGPLLRSFSTFSQPFSFGLYVAMCVIVCGAVALHDTRRLRNRIYLLMMPVLLAGMFVSVVRAAYLAVIVGMIWLAIFRYRRLFLVLFASAIAGGIALLFVPTNIVMSVFSSSSLGDRTDGWSQIGQGVREHPFGAGLGTTGSAAEKVATAVHNIDSRYTDLLRTLNPALNYQPDNYYVKILLEVGPIGLWALLLMLVTVVVSALRASRATTGADSAFCLGVSAYGVGVWVAAFVSTYFEIFPLDFYFWLLVGAVGSAVVQGRTNAPVPEASAADDEPLPVPAAPVVG